VLWLGLLKILIKNNGLAGNNVNEAGKGWHTLIWDKYWVSLRYFSVLIE
jgi:hypothetical protein